MLLLAIPNKGVHAMNMSGVSGDRGQAAMSSSPVNKVNATRRDVFKTRDLVPISGKGSRNKNSAGIGNRSFMHLVVHFQQSVYCLPAIGSQVKGIIVYIQINVLAHDFFTHFLRVFFYIISQVRIMSESIINAFADEPVDL